MADEKETQTATEEAPEQGDAVKESEDFDAKLEESETAYPEGESEDDAIDVESDDDGDDESAESDTEGDDKSADEKDGDAKESAISDDLLRRAERLGLDADEAKAFKNTDTLTRILDSLETKTQAKAPEGNRTAGDPENPFKFKLSLDKEIYDEGLIGQFEAINDHYSNMIGSIFKQVGLLVNQRYTEQFDNAVSGLGDDWKGVFGKGSHGDLDPNSGVFKARARLDSAVAMIQKGRESLGKPPLPFKEAFEKALHAEFHGDVQKIKDGKISKQMQHNKRQIVGRGSRVKGKPLTGHEEALQISRQFDERLASEGFDS